MAALAPVFTVGHSTRPIGELLTLLQEHGIRTVVDVRTIPRSRRNPQYGAEQLAEALGAAGIGYVSLPKLGGLRRPRPGSPNGGWRNASFRGYADHMDSPDFARGLAQLLTLVRAEGPIVLLCAEAVPWRCHR